MSEKSQNEPFSILDFKEELKTAVQQPQQSKIPLFIAFLAALLSIITLADAESTKLAMSSHIEASNKFAYFQSKTIRGMDALIAAKIFEKLDAPELARQWQSKSERYENEKAAILVEARKQEKIRAKSLLEGNYFKVGVTLLQIAIVLASASLILNGGLLFVMSFVFMLVSLVYSVNGYGLYVELPTDLGSLLNSFDIGFSKLKTLTH